MYLLKKVKPTNEQETKASVVHDLTLSNRLLKNEGLSLSYSSLFPKLNQEDKANMKSKSKIKNINSKQIKRYALIICTIFTLVVSASPQINFHKAEESVITVAGTSTFKSWAMTSKQMRSDAKFDFNKAGNPKHLNSLTFKLQTKSLLSGSSGLDKNAYSALKTDKHPDISYRSVSSTIFRNADGSYKISVKGSLSIAGVTREKNIDAVCISMSNGSQSCSGETKLLMTDFGVKPPVFMMGAMKTGNEITINYKMNYKP